MLCNYAIRYGHCKAEAVMSSSMPPSVYCHSIWINEYHYQMDWTQESTVAKCTWELLHALPCQYCPEFDNGVTATNRRTNIRHNGVAGTNRPSIFCGICFAIDAQPMLTLTFTGIKLLACFTCTGAPPLLLLSRPTLSESRSHQALLNAQPDIPLIIAHSLYK